MAECNQLTSLPFKGLTIRETCRGERGYSVDWLQKWPFGEKRYKEACLLIEGGPSANVCIFSYDPISRYLDLDPVTLIHEPDLDI